MNYERIYNQIIERAKSRQLEGYIERHHIIPKCMGGNNDKINIVELTAREHFICHMLLVEIYHNEPKLKQALWLMSTNRNKKEYQKYKVSARTYERIKNERIIWWGYKISESLKGKSKPKGFGKNISEKLKGIKRSNETKNKISKGNKGKTKHSDEFRQMIQNVHKNKIITLETKHKLIKALGGKIRSAETRQKMRIASLKKDAPSKERNDKISKSMLGKLKSEEHKQNMSLCRLGKPTKRCKPIIQYDLEGNFIKEWNKISEALNFLNRYKNDSSITACCKGKQITAYGYKWKYKEE